MYRVIRVVAFLGIKHQCTRMAVRANTGKSFLNVQRWRRLIWSALNQQWAVVLAQHWTGIGWVGLHCVYQLHRIDAYIDLSRYDLSAPVMVVEGICLHVEDILVSLVLSIIISWTFRILAHEENQYSYVYKILCHFLSKALKQTKAGPPVRELLF